jgi:all-trans-8'-apo-beta-carotenal 15,15'-oxygenase
VDDHAPLLERAFTIDVVEHAQVALAIHGELPSFFRGTCYVNGPARFERSGLKYRHWLDGDGMVCALALGPDGARFTNRFVRSEKFVREEAEGRPVFRTFGTAFPNDVLRRGIGLESPVNVSVYPFGGVLLAFGEQGLPLTLDPRTLETRGLHTFDGQLNDITPFSAHPKIDHDTGELFNFGVSFSSQHPRLNLFRFAPDGTLTYRRRLPLPYASSIHDFAISEQYVVVYVSPLVLRMEAMLQSGATVMDALSWQPELGSRLVIASRDTGLALATLDVGQRHCLHLVNAFELDGLLVVDVIEFEKPLYPEYQVIPDLFTDTFRGRPVRFMVDVEAQAVVGRHEIGYSCSPDFPAHDPHLVGRPYDQFWVLGIGKAGRAGRKFFDQMVRIDMTAERAEVWQAPDRHYLGGEPLFVPNPRARTEGVVVCQLFDADNRASSFVVFDARRIPAGPIATLPLPSPIPLLFHSAFSASAP